MGFVSDDVMGTSETLYVAAYSGSALSDITYIATNNGWLYLAVLLDLYSRRVVG